MCLILFAYQQHPHYHLVLAANRDEYYARPSAALDFWRDAPELLAGRDLQAGGTWLGMTRNGRVAAITNYREGYTAIANAPSRGKLVRDFLQSDASAAQFIDSLARQDGLYNGFNILLKDESDFVYYSNRSTTPAQRLKPGLFGLSNHLLNTPWPKVMRGCEKLNTLLQQSDLSKADVLSDKLLSMLEDRCLPAEDILPATGIPIERERILAPMFIQSDSYGTRSSTVLLIDYEGQVTLTEKTIADNKKKRFEFKIANGIS
ncbi:MAG: NRDE family protein [Phycisphaerae bacterium]|nr:NRDE family protein [Phycisphaerae bacterium]NIW99209.1 hypothetical protein [Phycisphaerae bacterium]